MAWKFYNSSGQLLTAPASTASADLATEATNVTVTQYDSESASLYPVFVDGLSSTQGIEADSGLTYNPSSGLLTAAGFSGPITGNVTGNTSGSAGSATGNAATATEATNVTVSANNGTDETVYPVFVDGATGTQGIESDTGLTYNPSTGVLTSTNFTGALTGTAATVTTNANLTGNVTSSGNATTLVLNDLAAATVSVANDSIAIIDADGSNASKKESIADLVSAMAGSNLTASSGQLSAAAGVGLGMVIALS